MEWHLGQEEGRNYGKITGSDRRKVRSCKGDIHLSPET